MLNHRRFSLKHTLIQLNTTAEKFSNIGVCLHRCMMLKENVQNNYGNASFPKFLWAVQLITEAVWSPTRLTKQLLLGLLQLPSGNSCAAAGRRLSEFLKILWAKKRKEVNVKVCWCGKQWRAAHWSHCFQASKWSRNLSSSLIYLLSLSSVIIFSISLLFQGFLPSADANVWQAVYSPCPSLFCWSHFSLQSLCGLDFIWSFTKSRFTRSWRLMLGWASKCIHSSLLTPRVIICYVFSSPIIWPAQITRL